MAQEFKIKSTSCNWCLLMHFGVSLMYLWSASESLWMRSDYILIASDDILITVSTHFVRILYQFFKNPLW